jgi:hypothetical protein
MKIKLEPLVAILSWAFSPVPIYANRSQIIQSGINLSDGGNDAFSDNLLYDFEIGEAVAISQNWRNVLDEFYREGELYWLFLKDMSEFVKGCPPKGWFE